MNATGATHYPAFSILLVDDEVAWLRSLTISLERNGITNIIQCQDSRNVMDLIGHNEVGLVLLDLTMPHLSGEDLLATVVEQHPEVVVIVISGMNQIETAVKCVKTGAFNYFVKTAEEDRLITGIQHAIHVLELQKENQAMTRHLLSDTLEYPEAFKTVPSSNKVMRSIFHYVESVAKSNQPILITGESGVGKGLIAHILHRISRGERPMVSVNVSGLDDTLFADTLFGHVKGAFTGAEQSRNGMVEEAANGTLFLDEIGELSIPCQIKLLRLLQEGEYFPLGSDKPKRLRARVIVATNQDLTARLASGHLRKDLYYRLRTHHIHLPPLRERKDDLDLLLNHFLEEASKELGKRKPTPPKELVQLLGTYTFPGNVRELRAMVYDSVSLHKSNILSMDSFLRAIGRQAEFIQTMYESSCENSLFQKTERLPTLSQAVELLITEAMCRAKGNQTIAARLLGISQPALSKRLKQSGTHHS